MGLFSDVPLHTNVAIIELKDNSLSILPTQPWGAPGLGAGPTKREIKSLIVPYTPWEDAVRAVDVIGIRKFGSDNILETINEKVLEKFQQAKDIFDRTNEFRKVKALQGIVLDADGVTTLFNSFDFFGITKKSFDFKLGDTTADVPSRVRDVKRYIEDNLRGETLTRLRVLVGAGFYDKLVKHQSVKEIWLNWSGAQARLGTDLRLGFVLEGVIFEEYCGFVPTPSGGTLQFIADNYCLVIPEGTQSTFKRFVAPADYLETVNTLGQPYYANQEVMGDKRGIKLTAQLNTLPICCRPDLLAEVKTSN
jgi:hypothetical protein